MLLVVKRAAICIGWGFSLLQIKNFDERELTIKKWFANGQELEEWKTRNWGDCTTSTAVDMFSKGVAWLIFLAVIRSLVFYADFHLFTLKMNPFIAIHCIVDLPTTTCKDFKTEQRRRLKEYKKQNTHTH